MQFKFISAAIGVLAALPIAANAQYTEHSLPVAGNPYSGAEGVGGSQVVGYVQNSNDVGSAALWDTTTNTLTSLAPAGMAYSFISGTTGTQQAGTAYNASYDGFAGIWSGTAASFVNLNPSNANGSSANGIFGNQVVGYVEYGSSSATPTLWTGTAASVVNLANGAVGQATATDGTNQVGWIINNDGGYDAVLWSGTAASMVDLNPDSTNYTCRATSVYGNLQGGTLEQLYGGAESAALWSGTAASYVDLNPAGATQSEVLGIYGNIEVGDATINGHDIAGYWTGTAASWHALALTSTTGQATGITAYNGNYVISGTDGYNAVYWTAPQPVPEPISMTLLGLGSLALLRKKRS